MNILTVVDEGEEEEEDDVDDYPHALRNADYVPQTSEQQNNTAYIIYIF